MGHIRPEATVESVVGVRAHPDTVSQMASNHSRQRLQLASPLGDTLVVCLVPKIRR